MKHYRLLAAIILCLTGPGCPTAHGQALPGAVSGKVVLENDEPAPAAIVTIENTRLGASTREDGTFIVAGIPAGLYRLRVRLVGYEQVEAPEVNVYAGGSIRVVLRLRQVAIELGQIIVTGNRRQAAADVRTSVTTMAPGESKYLPGAAEDVLRSLQALPGVTSVSDFSSQLVVRGSGPDQNLIMIDGFEVLNPYRLYGFVSMFNPETVSDISLQTGGFGAAYGDRLSAVLDVKNREGKTEGYFGGKLNASLTNVNLILEGGLPLNNASYLISARRTYYDLILGPVLRSMKLVQGDVALPNFRDLQAKISLPLSESHKLLFNVFTSRDGVELISGAERDRPDSVNVFDRSFNTLVGITWQYNPEKNFVLETRLSWYRNDGAGSFDGTFVDPAQNSGDIGRGDTVGIRFVRFGVNYDYKYTKTSLSQHLLLNTGAHALEAGYGIDLLQTDFIRYFDIDGTFRQYLLSRGQAVPVNATEAIPYHRLNGYVQDRIAIDERLFIQPGIRLDVYPSLKQKTVAAPRINVSLKLDDLSTLRAAYGIYYQSPGMEKLDFRNRVIFRSSSFATLDPERADHFILGYDRMLSPEWQFKVETYYKRFTGIIVPVKLQGATWVTETIGDDPTLPSGWATPVRTTGDSLTQDPVNGATGESYGAEILIQKIQSSPGERFTGWASYALSYAMRSRDGVKTPFLFDQRHAVNLVVVYKFAERWDVGIRYTLRSGRPYAIATGVSPRIVVASIHGVDYPIMQLDERGHTELDPVYERDTYSGRLNVYQSLDVRLTTYPRWWGLNWSAYLDVQNVYNRKNEQQVSFYVDESGALNKRAIYGIPIFPSLGMSLTF